MGFAKFMATGAGRGLRMVAGLVMIIAGLLITHGTLEKVLAVVGIAAFATGFFNVCLIAPLIGAPFRGKDVQ